MAYGILSAKLCELEDQIARMQSRIQISESSSLQRIYSETEALKEECRESRMALEGRLDHSRAEMVKKLAAAYKEIEQIVQRADEAIKRDTCSEEDEEMSAENKLLLAEYQLDFSLLAANQALLASLDAIGAQLTLQEKEKKAL